MARWRKALAIAGWFFLGAVFGPPLLGAASTLSWVEAADGNTAVGVTWRLYDRLNPPSVGLSYAPRGEHLDDTSLGISCWKDYHLVWGPGADMVPFSIYQLMHENALKRANYRAGPRPGYRALLAMPRPLLGAIDACIGASPILTHFCEGYARKLIDRAQAEEFTKKAEIIEAVREESENAWCPPASRKASKSH